MVLTIETPAFSRLTNAQHVEYHHSMLTLLDQQKATNAGVLPALLSRYQEHVTYEQDLVKRSFASDLTIALADVDSQRDKQYRLCRCQLEMCTLDTNNPALKAIAPTIEKYLLGVYSGSVLSLPMQEKTAHLRGFTVDCRKYIDDDTMEAIEGLDEALAYLDMLNERYEQLYVKRTGELAQATSEETKAARAACDEDYARMKVVLDYFANSEVPDDRAKQAVASTTVPVVNKLCIQYRALIKRKAAGNVDPNPNQDPLPASPLNGEEG